MIFAEGGQKKTDQMYNEDRPRSPSKKIAANVAAQLKT
jgi:hypothetical protein